MWTCHYRPLWILRTTGWSTCRPSSTTATQPTPATACSGAASRPDDRSPLVSGVDGIERVDQPGAFHCGQGRVDPGEIGPVLVAAGLWLVQQHGYPGEGRGGRGGGPKRVRHRP